MNTTLSKPTSTSLVERSTVTGGRVDRAAGVIKGVRVIGPTSLNGREYSTAAMDDIVRLGNAKGGVHVYENHPPSGKPGTQRDLQELVGFLEDFWREGDAVRADFTLLPGWGQREKLLEVATKSPNLVGMSINAIGAEANRNGRRIVESVERLRSVDLVLNPATVRGLFEADAKHRTGGDVRQALRRLRGDRMRDSLGKPGSHRRSLMESAIITADSNGDLGVKQIEKPETFAQFKNIIVQILNSDDSDAAKLVKVKQLVADSKVIQESVTPPTVPVRKRLSRADVMAMRLGR